MNIAVFGARGRVGSKVVEIAKQRGHTVLPIDISVKTNNPNNNEDDCNSQTESKECAATDHIDAVIDFSTAAATAEVCEFCRLHRCGLITGVTGRNEEQTRLIEQLKTELSVVAKANFSVGVDILHRICEIVAKELADWDCDIVEIHRKGKSDSPSGTAKSLAASVVRQKSFKKITVHSLRCGSNFGKHEVIFATNGESLTLTHQAENVEIFAKGAVLSAEQLKRLETR